VDPETVTPIVRASEARDKPAARERQAARRIVTSFTEIRVEECSCGPHPPSP
jgi:hypothetical protein